MDALKIKKGPIILPLVLLAAALAVYALAHMQRVSAADCITLGQQYLNDMNYEGAIVEFTNAIELDPNNVEARVGLAGAYIGTDSYAFAQEILDPMLDADQPVEDAAVLMVDLLEQTDRLPQAVELAQTLVTTTDKDEYYEMLERLMASLHEQPRRVAEGTDQVVTIQNGAVMTQGSNTLGQLGLAPSPTTTGRFADAQFSGQPVKVACVGRTSFVVDQNGTLWAAGENRWGQWGEGYAATAPQGGWTQLNCPGSVLDVAGTTGRLLVLLEDGSLWTVGAEAGQSFQLLNRFPRVAEISASQTRAAVLTTGGSLYTSDSRTPDQWMLVGRDVSAFTLSEDKLCWLDGDNGLHSDGYSISVPDSWQQNDGSVRPDEIVTRVASVGGLTLCTMQDGALVRLPGDGTAEPVDCDSPIAALYAQGRALILEHTDGTVQCWGESDNAPQPLERYFG